MHSADVVKVTSLTVTQAEVFCDRASNFSSILDVNQRLLTHAHTESTPWPPLNNFRIKRMGVDLEAVRWLLVIVLVVLVVVLVVLVVCWSCWWRWFIVQMASDHHLVGWCIYPSHASTTHAPPCLLSC